MKFRLSAGKPASSPRGGFSIPEPVTESKPRYWAPNTEKDTSLKCGCSVPWPVMTLLGSGGKVWCDQHGWQNVTKKETDQAKQRARKEKTCPGNQTTLDVPPF